VANVDARVHDDPADWPGLLSAQLCSPVRWRQTLETFAGLGLTSLIELGPGGVLSGLAKRSLPEIQSLAVAKPADLDTLMDQIAEAGTWRAEPALHQGEHLYMSERVVVSPGGGIFTPESRCGRRAPACSPGTDGGRTPMPSRSSPWAIWWAGSASPRCAPPSPARSSAGWPPPASGSRTASRWSGCASRTAPDGRSSWSPGEPRHRRRLRRVVPGQRGPGGHHLPLGRSPAVPRGADAERFLAVRCDVTDAAQVESAFATIESTWGPVEVLVANAGITRDGLMLRMSEEAFTEVIDANLTGSFRVAKRAVAKMLRLHTGRIIFLSSVSAYVGLPGQANYAASKAGLVGMARAIAREVGSRQITVNVVAPGLVATDMTAALGEERVALMTGQVPLGGRIGSARTWPAWWDSWPPPPRPTSPAPCCRSTAAWAWACSVQGTERHKEQIVDSDAAFEKFRECAVEVLQVPADKITKEAKFAEDLDADSLDLVELVMALEESFDITVEETELEDVTTIGQAFDLISSKL
jgi:3-oxoacyl-[acyl-carrier protein] reductase